MRPLLATSFVWRDSSPGSQPNISRVLARADDTELRPKDRSTWTLVSVVVEDQETKARCRCSEHPKGGRSPPRRMGAGSRWSR